MGTDRKKSADCGWRGLEKGLVRRLVQRLPNAPLDGAVWSRLPAPRVVF